MSRRTHRRRLIKEEVIPKMSAMLEAAQTQNVGSEAEVRIHDADSMWVLRMQLVRVV